MLCCKRQIILTTSFHDQMTRKTSLPVIMRLPTQEPVSFPNALEISEEESRNKTSSLSSSPGDSIHLAILVVVIAQLKISELRNFGIFYFET